MEIRHRRISHVVSVYVDGGEVESYDVNGTRIWFANGECQFMRTRSEEDYEKIKAWCRERLLPYMTRKTLNPSRTSYGLKHIAEQELGFYVCNADVKLALTELGVKPGYCGRLTYNNQSYPLSEDFYKDLRQRDRERGRYR